MKTHRNIEKLKTFNQIVCILNERFYEQFINALINLQRRSEVDCGADHIPLWGQIKTILKKKGFMKKIENFRHNKDILRSHKEFQKCRKVIVRNRCIVLPKIQSIDEKWEMVKICIHKRSKEILLERRQKAKRNG